MATKTTKVAESAAQTSFTSLKDSAYQQAGANQTLESVARYAIEKIAGFPETVSPEAKDQLYEGYRMKYDSLHPAKTYAVIADHYVEATPEHMASKNVERVEIGVAYAYSYSSQEFGKLANTKPALHALIKRIRESCSDYCSNRLGDLKRAAKSLLSNGQTRSRQTLDFIRSTEKIFTSLEKSVKVKSAKGDTTANPVQFKLAVAAFWKTYG
jgi:hypothetical protein